MGLMHHGQDSNVTCHGLCDAARCLPQVLRQSTGVSCLLMSYQIYLDNCPLSLTVGVCVAFNTAGEQVHSVHATKYNQNRGCQERLQPNINNMQLACQASPKHDRKQTPAITVCNSSMQLAFMHLMAHSSE